MLIPILLCVSLLLLTSVLSLLLLLYYTRQRYTHIPSPPLPPAHHPRSYIPGHLLLVRKLRRENPTWTFMGGVIDHLYKSLHTKTMALFFFHRTLVFTIDMGKVPSILSDHEVYKKDTFFRKAFDHLGGTRLLGKQGILTNPGDEIWYTKRKILDAAFHKKYLKITFDGMSYVANKLAEHIESNYSEEVEVDMFPILGRTALEIVSRTGFSMDEDLLNQDDSFLTDAIAVTLKTMALFFRNSFSFNMPWYFRREKKEVKHYLGGARQYLSKHVISRITNEDGNLHSSDILSYIIKANSYDDRFTVEDIVDEFLTFAVAGMETTSNSMAFFIYHMLKHPDVYVKVQSEVDEVYGERDDLEYEDLNNLMYLEQAIKESMRIMSTVEGTGRVLQKDMTVDGLFLPRNTVVQISQSLIHLDPDNWTDPLTYDPDRFRAGSAITPFTYMPFMAGPRSCIGKHFAMLEMKIVLSKLMKRFGFGDPAPDVADLEVVSDITLKPKHGMPVIITFK